MAKLAGGGAFASPRPAPPPTNEVLLLDAGREIDVFVSQAF
jgi:hypothetical protein